MLIKNILRYISIIMILSLIACGGSDESDDQKVFAPDYKVSTATYTGTGLSIEGKFTLENAGNTDGSGFTWSVYRSADTVIDGTDVVVDSDTISSLESNSMLPDINYSGTFPPETKTYYLLITTEADDDNDNTNNTYTIGPVEISPMFEENFDGGNFSTGNAWTVASGYSTSFPLITGLSGGEEPDTGTNCILTSTALTTWNDGCYIDLNGIAPTYISFYMRVDADDKTSVFYISENTGQQIFRIIFTASGDVRGNNTDLDPLTNANIWYHIELKNIDWTNQTLDFYAENGTDSLSQIIGEHFSNSANGIAELSLVSTEVNAWFDEIVMY